MSIVEILILVAMVGYAIYRQTQQHEVVGSSRFKLAIIYAVVGLVVGGSPARTPPRSGCCSRRASCRASSSVWPAAS